MTAATYVIASVSTRNFDFTCLAESRQHANVRLEDAWARHAKEYGADPRMMFEMIRDGDVNYTEVRVGSVTRDGEVILR